MTSSVVNGGDTLAENGTRQTPHHKLVSFSSPWDHSRFRSDGDRFRLKHLILDDCLPGHLHHNVCGIITRCEWSTQKKAGVQIKQLQAQDRDHRTKSTNSP